MPRSLPHLLSALLFSLFPGLSRGHDSLPGRPQDRPVLIRNAVIHPISSDPIPGGWLLFEDGCIRALGPPDTLPAAVPDAEVIDLESAHLYPGFISAHSALGLVEINAVRATRDLSEPGAITPNLRAEIAVNPDSELIPVARANGVLTALTVPQAGRGGFISGTSALMALDGWTWEDMTLQAPVGLHAFWPFLPPPGSREDDDRRSIAESGAARIREFEETLAQARAYQKARENPDPRFRGDLRLEALLPLLRRELPLFVHAETLTQIQDALDFTAREELRMILVGGYDAWRLAPLLREREVPVILSAIQRLPLRRADPYDIPFRAAAELQAAGVRFCIANAGSEGKAPHERNLPYQAAQAAAYGLDPAEALRAITLSPAVILGVADRLGSLDPGKDATLFVSSGDPLETRTQVTRAWIRGRQIDLSNRQTRLYDKYRQRYED